MSSIGLPELVVIALVAVLMVAVFGAIVVIALKVVNRQQPSPTVGTSPGAFCTKCGSPVFCETCGTRRG